MSSVCRPEWATRVCEGLNTVDLKIRIRFIGYPDKSKFRDRRRISRPATAATDFVIHPNEPIGIFQRGETLHVDRSRIRREAVLNLDEAINECHSGRDSDLCDSLACCFLASCCFRDDG